MASDENLRGSQPLNHLSRRQTLTLPGHGSAWNVTRLYQARAEWMVPFDQKAAQRGARNGGSELVGLEKARLRAHIRGHIRGYAEA